MKKKLLAASVAVALGALSGVASAAMEVQASGVGAVNVLPYYSVQEGNSTLISIVNTDTARGKAVKVRFRGAEWSDDVFDFQVFLSPGDVWTGAVTKDGSKAKLSTTDTSCTLPANVNQPFVDIRLQDAQKAVGTLEGYVEIITMADIVPETGDEGRAANWRANSPELYDAIKHVANGSPACRTATAAQTYLNELQPAPGADADDGMTAPTGSLTSFATIINVPSSKAFAFTATALNDEADEHNLVYFRQANVEIPVGTVPSLTADRIFYPIGDDATTELGAAIKMYQFDMPDLSTRYATDAASVTAQRTQYAMQLAKSAVVSEYVTADSIAASTDVLLSQPVRRYFYEYTEKLGANVSFHLLLNSKKFDVGAAEDDFYEGLSGATNRIGVGTAVFFDREENMFADPSDIVISPNPPSEALTYSLKGEVSVVSINNSGLPSGALNASITADDYTAVGAGGTVFSDGWAHLSTTTAAGYPLPVIGFTAINVFNAGVGAAGTNYGLTLPLRYDLLPF